MQPTRINCRYKAYGPYITLTPADIDTLYQQLVRQNLDAYLFASGSIDSPEAFNQAINRDDVWLYAAFDKDESPLALAILDTFKGCSAFMHFAFFRGEGVRLARPLGEAFLQMLFTSGFTCLLGCVSTRFRSARRFAQSLGFVTLGTLPGAYPICNRTSRELVFTDGWLGMCTPATFQGGQA